MRKKLRDDRGETLVEVLASILIASLSVALLFGTIMASSNIGQSARQSDQKYYDALSKAEAQTELVDALEITVANGAAETRVVVQRYGSQGAYSYAKGVGP